jgi:hypothetical protein
MRTGRNQKRRVCLRHVIQMDAYRDHARQQVEGRFDVDHAALDTPWTKSVYVEALPDRNRAVLMPTQRPVLPCAFVKENGANGKTLWTKRRGRNPAHRAIRGEEWQQFRNAGKPHSGVILRLGSKRTLNLDQFGNRQSGFEKLRAILGKYEGFRRHSSSTFNPDHLDPRYFL